MNLRKFLKKSKDLQAIYNFLKVYIYIIKRQNNIKKYLLSTMRPKLHLGAGSNVITGWLNTDFSKPTKNVIYLNVTKKFPFKESTFEFILAEHLIEHISYHDAIFMLGECYRTLKDGGVLRIGTPNLVKYLDLYKDKLSFIESKALKQITDFWIVTGFYTAKEYVPKKNTYNPVFVINDIFRNYEHRFVYDFTTLSEIVSDAGFMSVKQSIVGKSDFDELISIETHVDDVNAYVTLTIEAIK